MSLNCDCQILNFDRQILKSCVNDLSCNRGCLILIEGSRWIHLSIIVHRVQLISAVITSQMNG